MFFLHFMLFPIFLEKNNSGNKKNNCVSWVFFKDLFPTFKFLFFLGNIEECSFTYSSYWLNGRWSK